MRKWMWGVMGALVVAAVVVQAVAARAAEGGDRDRPAMMGMDRQPDRPQPRDQGDVDRKAQMMRSQIETLRRSADAFEQQGMPDLAQQMRERAEQEQHELEGLMRAVQQREGGPRPEGQMPDMVAMARHHEEMLGKLLDGQDRLSRQLSELNEKVSALQKDVAALRGQRER